MQNTVEMTKALQAGRRKGDGVNNCALEIHRGGQVGSVDTGKFSSVAHKARDNMHYTEFVYEGSGAETKMIGARFFAYYKMGKGVYISKADLDGMWKGTVQFHPAQIVHGDTLDGTVAELNPKMELNKESKSLKKRENAEKKAEKVAKKQSEIDTAEAAIEALRSSIRCLTCDRAFLRELAWSAHSKVCKLAGGKITKASREALALASNKFESLMGCEVDVRCSDDFPVPQDESASSMVGSLDSCKISWESKLVFMQSDAYKLACNVVLPAGWATKEQCRRPNVTFCNEVRSVLRVCFDATPRMNNYEIHKRLLQKFKLGPKVLRVGQIAGWVSSEVTRRKKAAMAAMADAANVVESALRAKGLLSESPNADEQDLDACIDEEILRAEDIISKHVEAMKNADFNVGVLSGWKRKWRSRLSECSHQHRERCMMQFEDTVSRKMQKAEKKLAQQSKQQKKLVTQTAPKGSRKKADDNTAQKKAARKKPVCKPVTAHLSKAVAAKQVGERTSLLPGQAWSNCCGSAVPEMELDGNGNCKDQSDASECKGRKQKRGKRKRNAPNR
jgi:hypothetical protein